MLSFKNAGGKTTPWMALITEDLHAPRGREGWKLGDLPEFSADPRPWSRTWMEFSKAWQTMVNAACARDFPAYSVGGYGDGSVHGTALHDMLDDLCVRGCVAHAHVPGARQPGTGETFRC